MNPADGSIYVGELQQQADTDFAVAVVGVTGGVAVQKQKGRTYAGIEMDREARRGAVDVTVSEKVASPGGQITIAVHVKDGLQEGVLSVWVVDESVLNVGKYDPFSVTPLTTMYPFALDEVMMVAREASTYSTRDAIEYVERVEEGRGEAAAEEYQIPDGGVKKAKKMNKGMRRTLAKKKGKKAASRGRRGAAGGRGGGGPRNYSSGGGGDTTCMLDILDTAGQEEYSGRSHRLPYE